MAAKGKKKAESEEVLTDTETKRSKRPRRTPRQRFVDEAPKAVKSAVKALRRVRDLAALKGGGSDDEWNRIIGGLKLELEEIGALLDSENEPEPEIQIFDSED